MRELELEPRLYQSTIVQQSSVKLAASKAIITHAPTGAGKTLVILMIVIRALAKGRTVLVLSEAKKVHKQLQAEMNGVEINATTDKLLFIHPNRCYVGMIQTLNKRPAVIKQLQDLGTDLLLLVDECHISTSCSLIDKLPNALRIGLTATPNGILHKHLPKYYFDFVEGPQVDFLIQEGFLCTYQHIARTAVNTNILELRNGDYSEESQERAFGDNKVYAGLFEDLRKIPYKKCVIFVASIKAADKLNKELVEHGFRSTAYHSQTENGTYELAKFTELDLCDIVVTIKSLSKGWNYPPIDLVVLMHKTTSMSLYLQEMGRGSRPIQGIKDKFIVLDYGDNWKEHGLYWDDRPWNELWKGGKKKRNRESSGVAPMKLCDKCESLISLMARKCEFCGHEQPYTEKELAQGELIDITEKYNDLVGRRISSLTPEELAIYAKIKNKKGYALQIAKSNNYVQDGWLADFAAAMGYHPKWVKHQKATMSPNPTQYIDTILR